MPLLSADQRYVQGVPGAIAQPVESGAERPGALDTLAAAFRQNNVVGALYDAAATGRLTRRPAPVADYDPLDDIAGFEEYADRFLDSDSPAQTVRLKQAIQAELADKDTIARAGGWGLAASLGAGVTDPATLASMLIPMAGATRTEAVGRAVLTQMTVDTASEGAFQALQETRSAEQSVLNVGAGAVLTGVLGVAVMARMPKGERDAAIKALDAELNTMPESSTVGAAARRAGGTLEEEGVAGVGEGIAKTVGKISPLGRLLTSPSKAARRIAQELAEVPFALTKNEMGVASPVAVETLVKRYDATVARWAVGLDDAYKAYRKRAKEAGEQIIKFGQFKEEVAAAMRRGDESMIPEVAAAAKRGRSEVVEPLKAQLQKVGLLPETVETIGAMSYLPRLYDVHKIKLHRTEWEQTLREGFRREGIEPGELESLVQQVTTTVLGTTRGYVQLDPSIVVKAGALKQRTIRLPDEILEPYLINDAERVLTQYVRSVAPQLEIAKRFDDLDMKQALQDLVDEYAIMQTRTSDNAKKQALERQLKSDFDDIVGMRDRLLGKAGVPADPDSALVRGARLFRHYNYVRLLGSQTLGSLADAGRVVTQYGLTRTGKALGTFATKLGTWKGTREQARRLAIGLDWTLNTRGATLAEIGEFAETTTEQVAQKATSAFTRITGMATWNSSMKFLAMALQQDELLDYASRAALSKSKLTKLAALGIDDAMLKRIAMQAKIHGVDDGLRRARTELWTDKQAALVFESALLKAADTAVLTKGVGDTPLLMSGEVAKTLLQFKGFGMAAVNRLVIPAAQGLQRGELAMLNGLLLMLTLGVLRYAAKQWTSEQPIDTAPAALLREGIDGAGLTTYLTDPYDAFAGMTGLPRFSRYTDRSWLETAAGPTAGTITDLGRTVEDLRRDGVSEKDIHKLRKLLPGQNIFYLRRAINALEQETAEALGVPEDVTSQGQ